MLNYGEVQLGKSFVSISKACKVFSLDHLLYTGYVSHPTFNPADTGQLSSGLKGNGCKSDGSSRCSEQVMNARINKSIPPYAFRAWCLIN
jgi:hypothetical protein